MHFCLIWFYAIFFTLLWTLEYGAIVFLALVPGVDFRLNCSVNMRYFGFANASGWFSLTYDVLIRFRGSFGVGMRFCVLGSFGVAIRSGLCARFFGSIGVENRFRMLMRGSCRFLSKTLLLLGPRAGVSSPSSSNRDRCLNLTCVKKFERLCTLPDFMYDGQTEHSKILGLKIFYMSEML